MIVDVQRPWREGYVETDMHIEARLALSRYPEIDAKVALNTKFHAEISRLSRWRVIFEAMNTVHHTDLQVSSHHEQPRPWLRTFIYKRTGFDTEWVESRTGMECSDLGLANDLEQPSGLLRVFWIGERSGYPNGVWDDRFEDVLSPERMATVQNMTGAPMRGW